MKARRIQALNITSGPTESGEQVPVAGELVPIDKLSVFLSSSWILILLILVLPIAFILYRKRDVTLKILTSLVSRLFEYRILR
ncbi:hypothetical protein A3K80_07615 [Candidatus Bathyarchaeota archaeon RBG_13_38_9]|nr:MAG: hypothetical protein A3K80_07615 [Candidatus Bathyarchaeota archaeon RBG_13_38_9]